MVRMRMNRLRETIWVLAAVVVLTTGAGARAQDSERPDLAKLFEKREVMIPVRDGAKLHTEIYTPRDGNGPWPIIMMRTPYGISAGDNRYSRMLYENADFFADGYIFVFQDIRGQFGSEGTFEMNRPLHDAKDAKGVDESTDTYDTIEWLVKNVAKNNGRVGIWGISYDGFLRRWRW